MAAAAAHPENEEHVEEYDHVALGDEQELFFSHPQNPGCWFFFRHGTRIYIKLLEFMKSEYKDRGYDKVKSPNIYNMELFEKPGHSVNYRKNMFLLDVDKQEFGLKPVNRHGVCLMFRQRVRSYRELPLRLADFGVLHRNEASDALAGLTCVRRFQQDGAHIFCMESQIKDEVRRVMEFIDYTYKVFGFTYDLKLSTRAKEHVKADWQTNWGKAETALSGALNEFGRPWQIDEGDGAVCGPKIDIHLTDSLRRKHQFATLELDLELPELFKLAYSSAEDEPKSGTPSQESKLERPFLIHRAILGSVEGMLGILLEHYKGKWPFWLSPRQAIVCPASAKFMDYAQQVGDQIHEAGYDVDVDAGQIREAERALYNYIVVVGKEEAKTGQVSVQARDVAESSVVMSIESLLQYFKDEAAAFH